MATKQDIYSILQRVKYMPNSPITEKNVGEIVDIFFVTLKDLSFDLLDSATLFYMGQENAFFPMPGKIRTKALELQMIALKIPTPAEAWGMVLNRNTMQRGVVCEASAKLHEEVSGLTSGAYLLKIKEIALHEKECSVCKPTIFDPSYAHPMVARAVHRMGGLDAALTDNPVADRARFIQAYTELLEKEMAIIGAVPEVRGYIESQSIALLEERNAAFETGERSDMRRELLRLSQGMTK